MVLSHLAKTTLLAASCAALGPVLTPPAVRDEVLRGKSKGYADAVVVEELLRDGTISVKVVKDRPLLARAAALNLQAGEAQAVALCWQEGIGLLATDDDNVRRKQALLGLTVIGTPAILLALLRAGRIGDAKLEEAVRVLRQVGWFSAAVLDQVRVEAMRWEKR